MYEQFFAIISLIIGLYLLYKLNPIKVDSFLRNEADRGLNQKFKKEDDWSSEGRVYTKGLSLTTQKNGRKKFIRQAKLADTGLLHNY